MTVLQHCAGQEEVAVGPLFIRKIHLTALTPDVLPHTHPFAHITFFMGGSVRVRLTRPDQTYVYQVCTAGDWLSIPAGVEHAMRVVGDEAMLACVFANRDAGGHLIETFESLAPTL